VRLCIECGKSFEGQDLKCPFCRHEPQRLGGHVAFAPQLAEDNEGFNPENFVKLFNMEAGNFWFRARNRLIIWALERYFPQAATFMEIGCGTGFVLSGIRQAFPELTLSGSEIFSDGLAFAAERLPGVALYQMDARRIPFREEFDVIGAFDVLEHIREDEQVLSQMYQATRQHGGILVTVPQYPFLWSQADDYAHHVRRYRARELKDKVRRAGFNVIRLTSFVSMLLPLLMLSRLKPRFRSEEFDPASEFNISTPMNRTLEKILDGERKLIRAGISFPAGGSLLLVARRD
jgi:SAM-dependent methyltransferase